MQSHWSRGIKDKETFQEDPAHCMYRCMKRPIVFLIVSLGIEVMSGDNEQLFSGLQ